LSVLFEGALTTGTRCTRQNHSVELAHGQLPAHLPVAHADQVLEHHAPQRLAALFLVAPGGVGAGKHFLPGRFQLGHTGIEALHAQLQKAEFQPTHMQDPLDTIEQPLVVRVIFVSENRNNFWTQELLEGYKFAHRCVSFSVCKPKYKHPI
jgi:hypothetical protein